MCLAQVGAAVMMGFAVIDGLLAVPGSDPSIQLALLHFERRSWLLRSWRSLLMVWQLGWKEGYQVEEAAVVFAVVLAVVAVEVEMVAVAVAAAVDVAAAAAASVVAVAAAAAVDTVAVHQGLASYMVFEGQRRMAAFEGSHYPDPGQTACCIVLVVQVVG